MSSLTLQEHSCYTKSIFFISAMLNLLTAFEGRFQLQQMFFVCKKRKFCVQKTETFLQKAEDASPAFSHDRLCHEGECVVATAVEAFGLLTLSVTTALETRSYGEAVRGD